jgi:hypothetical protein
MKFNLKSFSLSSINLSKQNVVGLIAGIWKKTHLLLFFALLFAAIIFGGYIWQQSLYGQGWSVEKKQEYVKTQNKSIIFKENDFQKVLDDIKMRKDEDIKEYQPIRDIFTPYK